MIGLFQIGEAITMGSPIRDFTYSADIARQVSFSAAKVLKLIDDTFRQEFFGKFDPGTFYLGSVYQEALDRLKKGEKDYAAQTFVLKHYPGLVDRETIDLSYIYYRSKIDICDV